MDTQVNRKKYFLSRQEAADALGLSLSSVIRAIDAGEIPHVKIGGRVLIPATFIDDLVRKALAGVEAK